ncbi:MAG: IS4 family transposase [Cytophagaceae bacterium]|nr:MAG: IS4 family transposase [Cytophagaceae bacterium]
MAHSCLAVDGESGETLGLLAQHRWTRAPKESWKRNNQRRQFELKESARWSNVDTAAREMMSSDDDATTVCDREADIYEFLGQLTSSKRRFVVRAKDRLIQGPARTLFRAMDAQPIAGTREITIEQRGIERGFFAQKTRESRPRRRAFLLVQARQITIPLPKNRHIEGAKPIMLNCVRVYEMEGDLEWILLTSEPIGSERQIEQIVRDYEHRWKIEEWHRWWKTGCRLEERPFQSMEAVERIMVILAPIATRLMQLHYLANQDGGTNDASTMLSDEEQECLLATAAATRRPIEKMTCRAAYEAIGRLGGFADTKGTGRIGTSTMWRGWMRFQDRFIGWQMARRETSSKISREM